MSTMIQKMAHVQTGCVYCRFVRVLDDNGKQLYTDVQIDRECRKRLDAERVSVSQDDCAHEFDPDEGYLCLNCGKDGAEDVLSAAADYAKDLRKYGR